MPSGGPPAAGRSDQAHLPPNLEGRIYYEPTDHGFESLVRERLAWRKERRREDEPATAPARNRDAAAPMTHDPQALSGEEPQEWPPETPPPEPRPARANRRKG